jgi:hypothetical protein
MIGECEVERIWNEEVVAWSNYYPRICLGGLRRTRKSLKQTISRSRFDAGTSQIQVESSRTWVSQLSVTGHNEGSLRVHVIGRVSLAIGCTSVRSGGRQQVATYRRAFLFLPTLDTDKGALSPGRHRNNNSYWSRVTLGHTLKRHSHIRLKNSTSLTWLHGTTFWDITDRIYEAPMRVIKHVVSHHVFWRVTPRLKNEIGQICPLGHFTITY